jgi:NAD(P)-dependent dehydrogenase (short-subunit alcohol dehydrogenase family)
MTEIDDALERRREPQLAGRVALVVGAGQTPGETIGNGRAVALLFAREGARVVAVDRDLPSAEETARLIVSAGGEAVALQADITREADIVSVVEAVIARFGRIDVLHNNVGVSIAAGDAALTEVESDAFDRITAINLRAMVMTCKHVVPVMRRQGSGAICNISSIAAVLEYPNIAYKTTKAAVVALTEDLAIANAAYGIRANCILPGFMNTPMAIESRVGLDGRSRADVVAERDGRVPLGRMGTALDTAEAALFLVSPRSGFVSGVSLRVDGAQSLRAG